MDYGAEIERLVVRVRELEDRLMALEAADRQLSDAVGFEAEEGPEFDEDESEYRITAKGRRALYDEVQPGVFGDLVVRDLFTSNLSDFFPWVHGEI